MIRILTLFICFVHLSFVVCCQSAYWQQQVNYSIDVTLNDVQHTLDGFVKMEYTNNSPDTLRFIWIHCWPNAYKNDKTAFTDQALENGSTRFYFSNNEERGYMNRLDFRVNGTAAATEDHPRHQDIVKLILPHPLPPHASAKIETPFHVKLPDVFSRGGHVGNTYQVTQWFPKAAVYDRKGWHPMPYLDQGEFYSDFGNYQVQITVPQDYVVAATGELQNAAEKKWQMERQPPQPDPVSKKQAGAKKPKQVVTAAPAPVKTKTLVYRQDNVHDFAWFADKMFIVKTDTLRLPSGRVVTAAVYYYRQNETNWANSIAMIKRAVQTKSQWLGEYPFNVVTVVDGGVGGGMEYPTITVLDDGGSEKSLDFVIDHEVGHNWFQGILASNERLHPWMDEGMNTYYDNRYSLQQYGTTNIDIVRSRSAFANNRLPDDLQGLLVSSITAIKKDQPIETTSENFNAFNYNIIAYSKTGQWMQLLERELGKPLFDSCMREYYRRWQFKHPYPEDFKKLIEEVSGRNLDNTFALLNSKGPIPQAARRKDIRFAALFSLKDTRSHNYIF
ncbi:MAG TPA: M1 family metallopeptidase, partial [Ferruginibacter sp.]|nr:M1 family metallopeptidase [Ferruginibacter sp.]